MGPSGGGKTSLLNALAGQVPATKGMRLRGELTINGAPRTAASVRQAYVQQEDMFYAQLTVRRVHAPAPSGMHAHSAKSHACMVNLGSVRMQSILTYSGYAMSCSLLTSPVQGPEHRLIWNRRQGRVRLS